MLRQVRTFQRTGDKADAVALAIRSDVFEIKGDAHSFFTTITHSFVQQ